MAWRIGSSTVIKTEFLMEVMLVMMEMEKSKNQRILYMVLFNNREEVRRKGLTPWSYGDLGDG